LNLSEGQTLKTEAVFNAMQSRAKKLGAQLVEADRQLDERFKTGAITAPVVAQQLAEIGIL
jgi:hypothetical protein